MFPFTFCSTSREPWLIHLPPSPLRERRKVDLPVSLSRKIERLNGSTDLSTRFSLPVAITGELSSKSCFVQRLTYLISVEQSYLYPRVLWNVRCLEQCSFFSLLLGWCSSNWFRCSSGLMTHTVIFWFSFTRVQTEHHKQTILTTSCLCFIRRLV